MSPSEKTDAKMYLVPLGHSLHWLRDPQPSPSALIGALFASGLHQMLLCLWWLCLYWTSTVFLFIIPKATQHNHYVRSTHNRWGIGSNPEMICSIWQLGAGEMQAPTCGFRASSTMAVLPVGFLEPAPTPTVDTKGKRPSIPFISMRWPFCKWPWKYAVTHIQKLSPVWIPKTLFAITLFSFNKIIITFK